MTTNDTNGIIKAMQTIKHLKIKANNKTIKGKAMETKQNKQTTNNKISNTTMKQQWKQ